MSQLPCHSVHTASTQLVLTLTTPPSTHYQHQKQPKMGLIGDLVSEFTHSGQQQQPQESYGGSSGGYGQQPPYVQPPWVARWDGEAGRWIFINEQTGARTFEHPGSSYQGSGYYQGGPPPSQGYGGGYGNGGYGGNERVEYVEEKSSGGNGLMYGAIGAAAGLAGGALLMHEGEKVGKFGLSFGIYIYHPSPTPPPDSLRF